MTSIRVTLPAPAVLGGTTAVTVALLGTLGAGVTLWEARHYAQELARGLFITRFGVITSETQLQWNAFAHTFVSAKFVEWGISGGLYHHGC